MTATTPRQCVVLAGGSGNEAGAVSATLPTSLLPCGDRPFLAWKLRELIRFGVSDFLIVAEGSPRLFEKALDEIRARLPKPIGIEIFPAPLGTGTAGALLAVRDRLDARFLSSDGQSLFDFNLGALLSEAASDPEDVLGRMVLRSEAGGDRPRQAGIAVLRRRLLDAVTPGSSLERDILPRLAAQSRLRETLAEGSFVDIGMPADLAWARTELPQRLRRPALFLDRDGVINVDHGYVATRERFDWVEGAVAAIRQATEAGWHVFVVTNQSGVARGLYDEAMVQSLHGWMADEIRRAGGTIDDIRYCPFHEDGTVAAYRRRSDWRKPAPGMILDLIAAWELDPARCVLVGDQPRDIAAAVNAGFAGQLFPGGHLAEFIAPILHRFAAPAAR